MSDSHLPQVRRSKNVRGVRFEFVRIGRTHRIHIGHGVSIGRTRRIHIGHGVSNKPFYLVSNGSQSELHIFSLAIPPPVPRITHSLRVGNYQIEVQNTTINRIIF
uniref:Uncharacterized protein n=1 Tax=Sipha flava TaxID=143950 RepID=A0A2S2QDJ4_9HEMI